MPKRAAKGQSLSDVAADIELEAKQRKERAENYPMCTRLSAVQSDKAIIIAFLDWLEEEKRVSLCTYYPHSDEFLRIHQTQDDLLMEYFGIDKMKLEKERRKILAAQRRLNGDQTAEDDD